MARNTEAGTAGQAAALPAADVAALRMTIMDMEATATAAFERIESLAELLLAALESPEAWRNPRVLVRALETIGETACSAGNDCGHAAEQVGCNTASERDRRRATARHEALRTAAKESARVEAGVAA